MAISSQLFWKRVGHVEVENASGKMMRFDGLDFKFTVSSTGDIYQDFSVSILGLSSETINELTVWSPINAMKNQRKIAVYAGYDQEGESLMAEGYVWYAVPSNPPEMWMNFNCKKYLSLESPNTEEMTFRDATRKEVFEKIARVCKFRPSYRDSDGDEKCSIAIPATKKANLPRMFAKYFKKNIYENCGMLICTEKHPEKNDPDNTTPISRDSGLLSVGGIDITGARIVTRLRNDVGLCEWIDLKSILVPSASGPYFVISKEIKGHFRGEEWQTEFKCLRKINV